MLLIPHAKPLPICARHDSLYFVILFSLLRSDVKGVNLTCFFGPIRSFLGPTALVCFSQMLLVNFFCLSFHTWL